MVALIGASGSGKSTLLRHIAGLITSDCTPCSVSLNGILIQQDGRLTREARMHRREIGFIFQQFNLVGRLSVMTNVLTGLLGRIPGWRGVLGRFTTTEKLMAMRALHRVGIERHATRRASTLSGGQQQRAAIARALVQQANVLLADEPIASLDPASAKKVMNTLASINHNDGITVVVCLHQVEYARYFCPRTIALKEGEVVFDGPSSELTNEFLKDIYGAASEELILPEGQKKQAAKPAPRPVMVQPEMTAARQISA